MLARLKHTSQSHHGFTIVELLIVIVVIGILAAITIVAFNGVQTRANTAVMQADLQNTAKKVQAEYVTTGTIPATLSSVVPAQASVSSNGAVVTYTKTGTNGFCISLIKNSTNYRITNTTNFETGTCPITNQVDNPSSETNSTGWSSHAALSSVREQMSGEWTYKSTRTATGASAIYINKNSPITVLPGQTYTASVYLTTNVTMEVSVRVRETNGNTDIPGTTFYTVPANTPTRINTTVTIPTDASSAHFIVYTANGAVGDVLTTDKAMFTQDANLYKYADGSSAGWGWNGTLNNSTSTGPAAL